jgi:hypothetical protein
MSAKWANWHPPKLRFAIEVDARQAVKFGDGGSRKLLANFSATQNEKMAAHLWPPLS